MKRLGTPQGLETWREAIRRGVDSERPRLRVCDGTGCRALGSHELLVALHDALDGAGLNGQVEVVATGCPGFCEQGPLVTVDPQQIAYQRVSPGDAQAIVAETLKAGRVIQELLYVDPTTGQPILQEPDLPFYSRQTRRVMALNGMIDPHRIEDYVANGGYLALGKALHDMEPEEIIAEISRSQLRGRGGAGFPTGLKWKLCRREPGDVKYIICNADEGDPGAFMDRSILEANPHSIIEGMIIGARAIEATAGFIYVRSEYPLAVENLRLALAQTRERGLLGRDILGSGFDFDIHLRLGAGAFVCGEETALMASIEGRPGEPRPRPPYPAQQGLWGQPTNINNVKSWASVPLIIANGADWFASVGTEESKGTAIFSMVGKINNTGLVEVPLGISLRELIFDVGGGIPGDRAFKAVQIGGPSGGCIPAEHLDAAIDYDSLTSLGATMGSGGLVVTDETTCMVDLARYFMNFVQQESCGQCLPCRWGTQVMLNILTRICDGQGQPGDIEALERLAKTVKVASLCGLGQTAPNPVLSTLRYFRAEYEAHIHEKRCPAKVCRGLIAYEIDPEVCTGCMVCARNCPVGAIMGEKGQPHVINQELCTRCGMCMQVCKFQGVIVHSPRVLA
jgi:NADH:ubiquinone oxidoreductase subunit F (NADH-binding)/(2Fe-2S) ferredoxin/Pyruvate/2-oxoacid:ferredoxin oxidoreductase delta subunit